MTVHVQALIADQLSGARPECGLPSAELLSVVRLVLAGRDQGRVPRPRQHALRIRDVVRARPSRCACPGRVAEELHQAARFPAFTRFNVFLRDRFTCQYCGGREELPSTTSCRARKAASRPGRTSSPPAGLQPAQGRHAARGRAHVAGAQPSSRRSTTSTRTAALSRRTTCTKAGWTISTGIANWRPEPPGLSPSAHARFRFRRPHRPRPRRREAGRLAAPLARQARPPASPRPKDPLGRARPLDGGARQRRARRRPADPVRRPRPRGGGRRAAAFSLGGVDVRGAFLVAPPDDAGLSGSPAALARPAPPCPCRASSSPAATTPKRV